MREVPSWNEYFMNIAVAVSKRSKDPNTQVGTVIVNKDNHIIGCGYNGFSNGFEDTKLRWTKKFKYDYVVHSEANALLNTTQSTKGARLYTTLYPCKDCAKLISAAKIKEIYYIDDKYFNDISNKIFKECNIKTYKMEL